MINPKFLYICPKDTFQAHGCKHFISAHAIDLPDGSVLVSGEFPDEQRKEGFEKHVTVKSIAQDGETVTADHAALLAHLGVQAGHTAKQVRALAKKIHGLM